MATAERQVEEMAFLASFLQYAIIMVILAAIAVAEKHCVHAKMRRQRQKPVKQKANK